MDCFFHARVPSVSACTDCKTPLGATCRDDRGACPSGRLAAKIAAAASSRERLAGDVGPASGPWNAAPPPQPPPFVAPRATVLATQDSVESKALVALGYPLFALALLSLLDRRKSPALRKQTFQALGFNVGFAGLWGALSVLAQIPILGISAAILLPFLIPVFIVASVYFGIKVWQGEDLHVPIIGDWIEERLVAH